MSGAIIAVTIRQDRDIVRARQRARLTAGHLGFDNQDQTRIATAVSEVGRNALAYAGGGSVEFRLVEHAGRPELAIVISDRGPGIPDVDRILEGNYASGTGLGLGLVGAKRLVDRMYVETSPTGTRVSLHRRLPCPLSQPLAQVAARVAGELARELPEDPVEEVQRQNRELLDSLAALRRREEDLKAALAEKEVLLREVYHRVKNNLQIISSLVSLKSRKTDDPNLRRHLDEVRMRIHAMSLLHEKLYQSDHLSMIDFGGYVRELCAHLRQSLLGQNAGIDLDVISDPVTLGLDSALQLGLLISEMISNALKHAFPGCRKGQVRVVLRAGPGERLTVQVQDDGVGLDADAVKSRGTLGMTLIHSLVARMDGCIDIDSSPEGTRITIDMPMEA